MKRILVLGAGLSSPYLIHHLLEKSEAHNAFVTVADLDFDLARERVANHPRGNAVRFDANDIAMRAQHIGNADVVVSLLIPKLHSIVAADCVELGVPLVTASYRDASIRDLEPDALRRGVLILSEMGMDPGLDHMSAMALIEETRRAGGTIEGFRSYGSGLPAPETATNPLRYVITWNPRNVVLAGQYGAQYMEDGFVRLVPFHDLFHHTWPAHVDGVGELEAYPNRDSLSYRDTFGLEGVTTMIRGTLRYPGWSETWAQIVRLGLTNDTLVIPRIRERTYREVIEMFLPGPAHFGDVAQRTAAWLQISPTGKIMKDLEWLGLFSEERVRANGATVADMMTAILSEKLALPRLGRDMVILQHEVDVRYQDGRRERIVSSLVEYGVPGGLTAMSKTVGLPAAVAALMILDGKFPLTGCHIPTHASIFEPVLLELAKSGLRFVERRVPLDPA